MYFDKFSRWGSDKSPSELVVFLHIPKTAGSNIRDILRQKHGRGFFDIIVPMALWCVGDKEINRYDALAGHMGTGILNRITRPCFSFTFLRDPVERVLSHYYYWRDVPDGIGQTGNQIAKSMDFETFIQSDHPVARSAVDNVQTWTMLGGVDDATFEIYQDIPPQKRLKLAKKNMEKLSFIGLQENFSECMTLLCNRLNWPLEAAQSESNVNHTRQRAKDLSPHTQELLRERVSLDIALYEHARMLSRQHLARLRTEISENAA